MEFLRIVTQICKIIFYFVGSIFLSLIIIHKFINIPEKNNNSPAELDKKLSTALIGNNSTSPKEQACLSLDSIPKNYATWCAAYNPQSGIAGQVIYYDMPYSFTTKYKDNKCIFTFAGQGIYEGNSYDFSFSCSINPMVIKTCKDKTPSAEACSIKANVTAYYDE